MSLLGDGLGESSCVGDGLVGAGTATGVVEAALAGSLAKLDLDVVNTGVTTADKGVKGLLLEEL